MNTSFSSLNGCVEIFVMIRNHDDPQQSFFFNDDQKFKNGNHDSKIFKSNNGEMFKYLLETTHLIKPTI
jgi:hypothetical protein